MLATPMAAPLGGGTENQERPPPMSKASMVGPLRGGVGNRECHHLC
jgi:hypothetical protein